MNIDKLKALAKSEIFALSKNVNATDVYFLIQALDEKDDAARYNAFLLLQSSSRESPLVYEYWSILERKLECPNSYQRSLGLMLIAENVRWDKKDNFSKTISKYLHRCSDEKFITARQAIQGLEVILKSTDKFDEEIKQSLTDLQVSKYKENQQKLVRKDLSNILQMIENKNARLK